MVKKYFRKYIVGICMVMSLTLCATSVTAVTAFAEESGTLSKESTETEAVLKAPDSANSSQTDSSSAVLSQNNSQAGSTASATTESNAVQTEAAKTEASASSSEQSGNSQSSTEAVVEDRTDRTNVTFVQDDPAPLVGDTVKQTVTVTYNKAEDTKITYDIDSSALKLDSIELDSASPLQGGTLKVYYQGNQTVNLLINNSNLDLSSFSGIFRIEIQPSASDAISSSACFSAVFTVESEKAEVKNSITLDSSYGGKISSISFTSKMPETETETESVLKNETAAASTYPNETLAIDEMNGNEKETGETEAENDEIIANNIDSMVDNDDVDDVFGPADIVAVYSDDAGTTETVGAETLDSNEGSPETDPSAEYAETSDDSQGQIEGEFSESENVNDPSETESDQPSSEPETDQPSSEPETEQPSSESETEQPATESETDQPSSESETEQPATEPVTEQPATEPVTEQPATEPETQQPSTETEPVVDHSTSVAMSQENLYPGINDQISQVVDVSYNSSDNVQITYKTQEAASITSLEIASGSCLSGGSLIVQSDGVEIPVDISSSYIDLSKYENVSEITIVPQVSDNKTVSGSFTVNLKIQSPRESITCLTTLYTEYNKGNSKSLTFYPVYAEVDTPVVEVSDETVEFGKTTTLTFENIGARFYGKTGTVEFTLDVPSDVELVRIKLPSFSHVSKIDLYATKGNKETLLGSYDSNYVLNLGDSGYSQIRLVFTPTDNQNVVSTKIAGKITISNNQTSLKNDLYMSFQGVTTAAIDDVNYTEQSEVFLCRFQSAQGDGETEQSDYEKALSQQNTNSSKTTETTNKGSSTTSSNSGSGSTSSNSGSSGSGTTYVNSGSGTGTTYVNSGSGSSSSGTGTDNSSTTAYSGETTANTGEDDTATLTNTGNVTLAEAEATAETESSDSDSSNATTYVSSNTSGSTASSTRNSATSSSSGSGSGYSSNSGYGTSSSTGSTSGIKQNIVSQAVDSGSGSTSGSSTTSSSSLLNDRISSIISSAISGSDSDSDSDSIVVSGVVGNDDENDDLDSRVSSAISGFAESSDNDSSSSFSLSIAEASDPATYDDWTVKPIFEDLVANIVKSTVQPISESLVESLIPGGVHYIVDSDIKPIILGIDHVPAGTL